MCIEEEFEWDDTKFETNIAKHGIDFIDAIGIFAGFILETRSVKSGEVYMEGNRLL